MSFISRLQSKPHHQKVRIIWMSAVGMAIILAIVWVLTSRIGQSLPKDTSLFKTFGQGVKDIRDQYNKK